MDFNRTIEVTRSEAVDVRRANVWSMRKLRLRRWHDGLELELSDYDTIEVIKALYETLPTGKRQMVRDAL